MKRWKYTAKVAVYFFVWETPYADPHVRCCERIGGNTILLDLSDKEASDWIERGLAEKIVLDTKKVEQTNTEKASEPKTGRSKK